MKSTYLLFTPYLHGKKRMLVLSVALALVQAASLIPIALVIQHIFDVALPDKNIPLLTQGLIASVALFSVNAVVTLWNRRLALRAIKGAVFELRTDVLERSLAWNRQWYTEEDIDAAHASIVQDTGRIDLMGNAFLTQFFPGVLIGLGLSLVLAYENFHLFVLVAVALPVLYLLGKIVGRPVRIFTAQNQHDFSEFSKSVAFLLKSNELIKHSTAEQFEHARQSQRARALQESGFAMAWWGTAYGVLQSNALILIGICVLLIGGLEVIGGTMSVGALLSFYVALNLLTSNVRSALLSIPSMIEGVEAVRTLSPLLQIPSANTGTVSFPGLSKEIVFDAVSFAYADTQHGLRNVQFRILKGQLFGVAGASGAGKSTLMHLLLGFYEPQQGTVRIDHTPVGTFNGESYRRRVGVLSQTPHLFSGSIRENLSYGISTPTDRRMKEVCEIVQIHDYISSLEHGYDTDIGQLGTKLSGGQRQRLALARALLRDPELLILDEPDNNLPIELCIEILQSIRTVPITVVLITHNRTLLAQADATYTL